MGRTQDVHISIIPILFKEELSSRGISIRSLGNPNSPNYIGVSSKTIDRALKNGWMTSKTLSALSDIMDIEFFISDQPDYEDYANWQAEQNELERKNELLKAHIMELKKTIDDCKNRLAYAEKILKKLE